MTKATPGLVERLRYSKEPDQLIRCEAADLIERLQAKLSELQQELGEAQNRIETDQKLIDSLEAKLSERDADAWRYRFLKSMTRAEHSMDQYDGHLYRMGVYDRNMVGLDAAIDEARKP